MVVGQNLILGPGPSDIQRRIPALFSIVISPFLALIYIIILPLFGIVVFAWSIGYRTTQKLKSMSHHSNRAAVFDRGKAVGEMVDMRDSIHSLFDKLEFEYMVIDREFHITQYYSPRLRQDKFQEQAAIGRHCFEVSHGTNKPCDSCECECPVWKVLDTNEKVSVIHFHDNPIENQGGQRLVEILASPIRDNQGNIIQIAELIWDINRVN